ncbi:MAG: hypothetical protein Q8J78_07820 [Moraxellaceae bacterium]|nr:hypothetical protein [Moraxellaceae bacterium]
MRLFLQSLFQQPVLAAEGTAPAGRRWEPAPRTLGIMAAVLIVIAALGLVQLMLAQPWAGFTFHAHGEVLRVAHPSLDKPADVRGLRTASGEEQPLPVWLAVEEPDFLGRYDAYNAFMAMQAPLLAEWQSGAARLLLADGRELPVTLQPRRLADIPAAFWLQLSFGFVALVIGAGIWVFRPQARDAALLLVTALAFATGTWTASVYSARELVMAPELFRPLSVLNHGGALLFDCSMLALLWSYPQPLGRQPVVRGAFLLFALLWLVDTLQLLDTFALGFYVWLLVIFLLATLCAWRQWRLSRADPVSRMALRWLILSFLIGSGAFVFLQVLPLLLGIQTPVSQSVMSGAFLIVYLGLAAGISRYRLFQLEQWWLVAWSGLFGGVLVLLLDGVLVWVLNAEGWVALGMAMAVAGWIYFPLRQWLVARLLNREGTVRHLPPGVVRRLFDPSTESALQQQWPDVVRSVFRPLVLEPHDGEQALAIVDDGLRLVLPDIVPGRHWQLAYCDRGARLFSPDDLVAAGELHSVAAYARDALRARQQGARLERDRIKRDLHDDLGARLLSILHGQNEGGMREEARQAIRDLRQMLATLDERAITLDEAARLMAAEARERLERAGLTFGASVPAPSALLLSARQYANLKRVVRECVTNVIKHADAGHVQFEWQVRDDHMRLTVSDDGVFELWALEQTGRGHHIIRSRVDELGGHVEWQRQLPTGCRVTVEIPVPAEGIVSAQVRAEENQE